MTSTVVFVSLVIVEAVIPVGSGGDDSGVK